MSETGDLGFTGVNVAAVLARLRRREVNYTADEVDERSWNFDHYRVWLPTELPGPPETGGVWENACRLIEDYEFSVPGVIRAAYDPTEPLLGRTLLLEGRFSILRLYFGVRITHVINQTIAPDYRIWGWSYETLEGHLERGRISYEVVKHQHTGAVEFVIHAYSQLSPFLGVGMRLGWALFGRRRQLLFYRECGRRMYRFTRSRGHISQPPAASWQRQGIVIAPSDARARRCERFAVHRTHPG